MTAVKDKAQEIIAALPDDATWSDLAYEVELRRKIDEGLKDLDEGRRTPHEEVQKRFLGR